MPVVPVVRTTSGWTRKNTMGVKIENKPVISMITTPPIMSGSPGVWSISSTARPGRKPISQPSAPGLRTLQFEHQIQSMNPTLSIEHLIRPLYALAESKERVQFIGGGMLAVGTWWHVTGFDVQEDMKAKDHRISRVTITWDLVEANHVGSVELTKTGVKKGVVTQGGSVTKPKAPRLGGIASGSSGRVAY